MTSAGDVAAAELRAFSGAASQAEEAAWLVSHGMLANAAMRYSILTDRDWEMPGSESYILQFSVCPEGQQAARFVMKACLVAPTAATLADWMQRRSLLAANTVEVPQLYAVARSTSIEEHIAYDLRTAYQQGEPDVRAALTDNFLRTFRLVHQAGFRPMGLHDARSRGLDVVLIDFGSDLGGPGVPEAIGLDVLRQKALAHLDGIVGGLSQS